MCARAQLITNADPRSSYFSFTDKETVGQAYRYHDDQLNNEVRNYFFKG